MPIYVTACEGTGASRAVWWDIGIQSLSTLLNVRMNAKEEESADSILVSVCSVVRIWLHSHEDLNRHIRYFRGCQ